LTGLDAEKERQNGFSVETVTPLQKQAKVILGPDGKLVAPAIPDWRSQPP
jgi:hypothetical protein